MEGWFNATPADAEGNVLSDPVDWRDPRMLEHPRVALVDAATVEVISTYDRIACSSDVSYVPTPGSSWPEVGTVIVDMDTGEVVEIVDSAR
ncbi:hypothetical protein [Cellulomonas triticagri]|uniref:Uncharacterized protein n=1 Tax=Cellulomonas triticagri TaxID=2483352 RepID=A0A3M2JFJ9_9CELL|nr:hypothetical protein [Cellulomonas triticagri]RMI12542.1 hypothetical protein EBM89_08185 [Cellulomonas triticagri]